VTDITTLDTKPLGNSDRSPETERTVSERRLCASCGAELTGRRRQAQYCSDRCRTTARRRTRSVHLKELLAELERAVADIKVAIGDGND
jgi:hypothetical protein